ncbi:MAG: SPOR domain-containing protein [Candidatus Omnitrophica bacterium]|nr:SPOR domain-containing protein [Candidatus Omnitrophota bacterium]
MDERREIQPELFDEFSQSGRFKKKLPRQDTGKKIHTFVLSNEQLILGSIGFIILLVIFFSLGVERGKLLGAAAVTPQKEMVSEKIQDREIASEAITIDKEPGRTIAQAGQYIIQVASYTDAKFAEKEKNFLLGKGFNAEIIKSNKHFVVNITGFNTRQEAEAFAAKIKDKYKDYIIKKKK